MKFTNILLIDDDEEDQEIFVAALQQISNELKYQCFTDARKVLKELANTSITPEIIFLDLNMPLMSGEEFLKIFKAEFTLEIPVIIFTTSSDAAIKNAMLGKGASDFLTKPNAYNELVNLLKPILL